MMKFLSLPLGSLACIAIAGLSHAQIQTQVLVQVDGPFGMAYLGRPGVVPLGDIDGDGVEEFASGIFGVQTGGPAAIYLSAYSGASGATLWSVSSPDAVSSIQGGGDVNGDGIDDVLWGRPLIGGPTVGQIQVVSGRDGSIIRVHSGAGLSPGFGIGFPGAIVGDTDADGYDDYLLSDSPQFGGLETRVPFLVSGRTGLVLHALPLSCSYLQNWSAALGDVDGDGCADFLVQNASWFQNCGPGQSCFGLVTAFSGRTGGQLYQVSPAYPLFVVAFAQTGRPAGNDINGDGFGDFVVYTTAQGVPGANAPANVEARSGVDGSLIWRSVGGGNDALGTTRLTIADDWTGDGRAEVLAGASWPSRLIVLSGADGSQIQSFPQPSAYNYGVHLWLAGDHNGDGSREMLGYGLNDPPFAQPQARGQIYVVSFAGGPLSYWNEFGRACLASNAFVPRASMRSDPVLGRVAEFDLRGTVPGSLPVFVLGLPLPPGPAPSWVPTCSVYLDPVQVTLFQPTNSMGMAEASFPVPAIPALAGFQLRAQWFVLDAAANASGIISSTGLRLMLGL